MVYMYVSVFPPVRYLPYHIYTWTFHALHHNLSCHSSLSHTRLFGLHIQIPINNTFITIALLQPDIRSFEMSTIQKPFMRRQGTWMHTFEHQMLRGVDFLTSLLSGFAPGEENHASCSPLRDFVNHFLRKRLPALFRVAVGFVGSDGQTGVEHEDSTVCPRREQTAVFRGRDERWIVLFECNVHVLQTRRCRSRWPD